MPRLLTAERDLTSAAGWKRRREYETVSRDRGVNAATKALTNKQLEASSHALASLWGRLRATLTATNRSAAAPTAICPSSLTTSAACTGTSDVPCVSDRLWQVSFPTPATVEDLIFHLIAHTEFFDRLSWLIAFCLISRLDLQQQVSARVSLAHAQNTASAQNSSSIWQSCTVFNREFGTLFTAYCLAIKWHCDYNVTVEYLVNLLPHGKTIRRAILLSTVAMESAMLAALQYNCAVTPDELAALVRQYALPEEQQCLAELVPHLADGTDRTLRCGLLQTT